MKLSGNKAISSQGNGLNQVKWRFTKTGNKAVSSQEDGLSQVT